MRRHARLKSTWRRHGDGIEGIGLARKHQLMFQTDALACLGGNMTSGGSFQASPPPRVAPTPTPRQRCSSPAFYLASLPG